MTKIKYQLFVFLFAMLASVSCEDVLDTKPGDAYSEADVFSNIALAERLLYYSYNATDSWGMNFVDWWTRRIGLENATDESWFHFRPENYKITRGLMFPDDQGFFRGIWATQYEFIGSVNEFIKRIEESPLVSTNPDEVNVLVGEARFLRAYNYMRLVNFYGGVVIVEEPFALTDDFKRERNSYQECVDFIVQDLDDAIAVLPETRPPTEFGRATKGAAMALKSRILLYAASPLHDPAQNDAPRGPLYDYDVASKWQDAADAAKALIDLGLYSLVPVSTPEEYQQMFLTPNSELIFARPFSPDFATTPNDFNTLPDKAHGTVSSGGWGLSNPTHNFVQDFKMANGLSIDEPGSGYDENDIYANRELRFYANINYQGATFRGIELEYWAPGGKDSRDIGPPNHFAATGYNLRKFMDESIVLDQEQSAKRPYPLARLPEIYLNYAEAQYHLGNETEGRIYASLVAERVGLPPLTSSGEALLEDIKYERQMELFFEGHRFFDLRRWMDAETLGEDIVGVQWERQDVDGNLDPTGTLIRIDDVLIEERIFNPENYYLPIPSNEIDKVGLAQNAGY